MHLLQQNISLVGTLCILFLVLLIGIDKVYAEDLLYKPHPSLDYIAVNNTVLSSHEEASVKVKNGDTVKIAGKGNKGDITGIVLADRTYEVNVDGNENWFSLFTIKDMSKDSYTVEIQYSGTRENEFLTTFIIQDDDTEGKDNIGEIQDKPFTQSILFYLLLALLLPTSGVIGWFLGSHSEKAKSSKR